MDFQQVFNLAGPIGSLLATAVAYGILKQQVNDLVERRRENRLMIENHINDENVHLTKREYDDVIRRLDNIEHLLMQLPRRKTDV